MMFLIFRVCFATALFALNASAYVMPKMNKGIYIRKSLFKKSNVENMRVSSSDAAQFVVSQVDEESLGNIMNETLSTSNDIEVIYRQQYLNSESIMERLRPVILDVVQNLLVYPHPGWDVYSHEDVTSAISKAVSDFIITKYGNERNRLLDKQKEYVLNKRVQSMINAMWSITTRSIRASPLDTFNIDKSKYIDMVEALIPELVKSTNYSNVRKVLEYPVVKDELIVILRKKNNVSYSVHDLTDKMFSKLVPFMREGLMADLKDIEKESSENSLQQIFDGFAPYLYAGTKNGLILADKLQVALIEELVDYSTTSKTIAMLDDTLETGVLNVMTDLHSKGWAAPGVVNDYLLTRLVAKNIRGNQNINIYFFVYNQLQNEFQKLIDSDKPLPNVGVLRVYEQSTVIPRMNELIMQKIDNFRRQNPQFTKCGANVLAATVLGSLKEKVKSTTREYAINMSSGAEEDQAVVDYIMESFNEIMKKRIEEEVKEQHDFNSGSFVDSEAFDLVKAHIESSIHAVVIKELKSLREKPKDGL